MATPYPGWWNVQPKNIIWLEHYNITCTKTLLTMVCLHNHLEVEPLTVPVRLLFAFCNSHLDNMSMKLKFAERDEPLTIKIVGRRPDTQIVYADPTPSPCVSANAIGDHPYDFSKEELDRFPPECYCPLSLEVFDDPIVASDGHTYERMYFLSWLALHSTSPMTGRDLETGLVFPNFLIRAYIQRIS